MLLGTLLFADHSATSLLSIGYSAARYERVRAITSYCGRCIDHPIRISGSIPCTARGKERGLRNFRKLNLQRRGSRAAVVGSPAKPKCRPARACLPKSPTGCAPAPRQNRGAVDWARRARRAVQHVDHRSNRQAVCRCDAGRYPRKAALGVAGCAILRSEPNVQGKITIETATSTGEPPAGQARLRRPTVPGKENLVASSDDNREFPKAPQEAQHCQAAQVCRSQKQP